MNVNNSNDLYMFFKHMSVCHSITVDVDSKPSTSQNEEESKTNNSENTEIPIYQCQSPDELALVKAACKVGLTLEDTKASTYFVREGSSTIKEHKILGEFKFDSDRKRMSVVVQEDKKFYLYTKGADSNMIHQIDWENKESDKVLLEQHLHKFACQGLRTLVMGRKNISEDEKDEIVSELYKIQASAVKNKEEKYSELYCKHETGLTYFGASAIEDKLQDKVPETIERLMKANIRVWVLTGDKQETAIEIAKS